MEKKIVPNIMALMCIFAFMTLIDDFFNRYFANIWEITSIVLHILQVILLILFCKSNKIKLRECGLKKTVEPTVIVWSFLIGIIIMILGGVLQSIIIVPVENETQSILYMVFFCLYAGLVAPIVEEIEFRGILFRNLYLSGMGLIKALLMSSCMFFLIHTGGINVGAFILAIISGIVVFWTGNLIYSIIIHFSGNFMVCFLFLYGSLQESDTTIALENEASSIGENILWAFILSIMLIGFICLFLIYIYEKFVKSSKKQVEKNGKIIKTERNKINYIRDFCIYVGVCIIASLIQCKK